MAAPTGYYCGHCGQPTDSSGIHKDIKNKGNSVTTTGAACTNRPMPVPDNWPLVRLP